tara:strand:+ start:1300 stop:1959 length:660 start_codon:yes stop_codon:yes gene_type:complete
MSILKTISESALGAYVSRIFSNSQFVKVGSFKSSDYWCKRYKNGKNSGKGSYGQLAAFKADVVNSFLAENPISTVIEFGCGDGNQLSLIKYPKYHGFDVSPEIVSRCKSKFREDDSKKFSTVNDYYDQTADLTISLDVIYHVTENTEFDAYMLRLFNASKKFVIIYSTDSNSLSSLGFAHIKHRKFTDWIRNNKSEWVLQAKIDNKCDGSVADFFVYSK